MDKISKKSEDYLNFLVFEKWIALPPIMNESRAVTFVGGKEADPEENGGGDQRENWGRSDDLTVNIYLHYRGFYIEVRGNLLKKLRAICGEDVRLKMNFGIGEYGQYCRYDIKTKDMLIHKEFICTDYVEVLPDSVIKMWIDGTKKLSCWLDLIITMPNLPELDLNAVKTLCDTMGRRR